jgi:multiple sugar transport system substrate-binding protein
VSSTAALRPAARHPRTALLLPQGRAEEGGPARRRRPDRPVTSTDEWFDVLKKAKAVQKKGLQTIGLWTNDQNFQWWFFVAFYTQLGGTWFDDANTEVTFDTDKATQVLEFFRKHVTDGYVIPGAPDRPNSSSTAPPSPGRATGRCRSSPARRSTTARPRCRPSSAGRPPTPSRTPSSCRTRPAAAAPPTRPRTELAAYVVTHALQWAAGGHIPAYTPTLSTAAYKKLTPQNEYVSAMDHQATEPKVWFAGSTGILAQDLGPIVVSSTMGSAKPAAVARTMKNHLTNSSPEEPDGRQDRRAGGAAA